MSKSMYSLILNDEVVAEVDRLAMMKGISRSEMITRILAERVKVVTPEQRKESMARMLTKLCDGGEGPIFVSVRSGTVNLRGMLEYKYRPTVHYAIEILDEGLVRLRISLRSQSEALLMDFGTFGRLFFPMERELIGPSTYEVESGRLTRLLILDPEKEEEQLCTDINRYVGMLDACLREFFVIADRSPMNWRGVAYERMRLRYAQYLAHGGAKL